MPKKDKKSFGGIYVAGMFFACGYVLTALLAKTSYAPRSLAIVTAAAVAVTIVLAARTGRMTSGALGGVGMGLAVGMGIMTARMGGQASGDGAGVSTLTAAGLMASMMCLNGPGMIPVVGFSFALTTPAPGVRPVIQPVAPIAIAVLVFVPMICCGVAGALFGRLAQRRRQRLAEE